MAKPMYFVNTGARYSFAQGRGMINFNFNDIFDTPTFLPLKPRVLMHKKENSIGKVALGI